MSDAPSGEQPVDAVDDLIAEHQFDYSKARPNRFVSSCSPGGRLVVLDPDIARVFTDAESVNSVLRALITIMLPTISR